MSKSRGTFIMAKTFLEHLDADYLRYYFAAKLNANVEDLDLNLDDFETRVNSDLIGKVVNIASRCAGFIAKQFDHQLAHSLEDEALYQHFVDTGDTIANYYQNRQYSKAISLIAELADKANTYVNDKAPWVIAKSLKENHDEALAKELHLICTQGINLFRIIIHYLAPVTPQLSQKSGEFLNVAINTQAHNETTLTKNVHWADIKKPLLAHTINAYQHLAKRVERKKIDAMLEASKAQTSDIKNNNNANSQPKNSVQENKAETDNESGVIQINDFTKVDLRIAHITHAEDVEGADKLLRILLDIGEEKPRQVFAGIKAHYQAADLIGKKTIMVANLAPRKMRFGMSEGMILAASDVTNETPGIFLLSPDEGATAGMKVK
jgi:methionyl-tRNA synthetase (EC 6.1.1.10)